eukprot:SAG25_NODE_103_length_15482_cov_9.187415_9_plen_550_part_00
MYCSCRLPVLYQDPDLALNLSQGGDLIKGNLIFSNQSSKTSCKLINRTETSPVPALRDPRRACWPAVPAQLLATAAAALKMRLLCAALLLVLGAALDAAAAPPACRDRLKQPFSSASIWNTAIGSEAVFVPANIFRPVPQPAGKDHQCALGKAKPAWRETCAGFQPSWTADDCLQNDCCYDPTPECVKPPAKGRVACGSGPGRGHGHQPFTPTDGCTAALGCCYSPLTVPGDWCIPMNHSLNGTHCGVCGTALPAKTMAPRQCYTKEGAQFSNASDWKSASSWSNTIPGFFSVDTDHFIVTTAADPLTVWYNQGFITPQGSCVRNNCGTQPPGLTCNTARNNCSYLCSGELVGTLPFPHSWTTPWLGNGAAAVLLPDNETLVQMQPLVRCAPGSPIFALDWRNFIPATGSACEDSPGAANRSPLPLPGLPTSNTSILSEGTWGGHGGTRLSAIGGTIRRGELLPGAPPIPHAIKLELFGKLYYWAGNATAGNECYRWPALNCDCWSIPSRRKSMHASNANAYLGSNPALKPGALLAVPAALSAALGPVQ